VASVEPNTTVTTKSNALQRPLAGEPQHCDEYGIGDWPTTRIGRGHTRSRTTWSLFYLLTCVELAVGASPRAGRCLS
jgi:hypothetical protein